jgi:hypothetical protein
MADKNSLVLCLCSSGNVERASNKSCSALTLGVNVGSGNLTRNSHYNACCIVMGVGQREASLKRFCNCKHRW